MRASITSAFGVPGENDNRRRVVELCAEKGLCVGNTYFERKSLHKCTGIATCQGGVELTSIQLLHPCQFTEAALNLDTRLNEASLKPKPKTVQEEIVENIFHL